MNGFRAPTDDEARGIARFFSAYYDSRIRICNRASSLLSVVGFVLLALYSQGGVMIVISGLAAYACVFKLIFDKKTMRGNNQVFADRKYRVLDGSVCQIQTNPDKPGVCNVKFTSVYGQMCGRWFLARQDGVEYGSPLLLVAVNAGETKGRLFWVFTPFMLTEDGSKLHW